MISQSIRRILSFYFHVCPNSAMFTGLYKWLLLWNNKSIQVCPVLSFGKSQNTKQINQNFVYLFVPLPTRFAQRIQGRKIACADSSLLVSF
jgi:hypothetical protein